MKHKILLALFLCIVIVFSATITSINSDEVVEVKKVTSSIDNFTIGNINEDKDNVKIDIYYPITKYENVNVEIMKKIQEYISKVKESEYKSDEKFLKISFEDFKSNENISFKFNVEYNEGLYHNTQDLFTLVYNDSGVINKEYIKEKITDEKLDKIKQELNTESVDLDLILKNFILNEDKVVIYVNQADISSGKYKILPIEIEL